MAKPRPANATHTLLRSALVVAKTPGPPGTFHLGGPTPKLSARATAAVALWCAARVRNEGSSDEAAIVDAHLAEASAFLNDPERARENSARIADSPTRSTRVASVSQLAVEAALRATCTPGSIRRPTRRAIQTSLRLVRDAAWSSGYGEAVMQRFIADLDHAIMRIEVESLLASRVAPLPIIARVLWRAAGAVPDRATHFIVAVEPLGYGLLAKLAHRYEWHEAARDEILATVPDPLMESAVRAVVGAALPPRVSELSVWRVERTPGAVR